MSFSSWSFLLFLPTLLFLHGLLRDFRHQKILLLVASYYFYSVWDARFLALIVASSLVDFMVGAALEQAQGKSKRRLLLGISLGVNLGALGFFKYYNFFYDSAVDFLHTIGVQSGYSSLEVILPVGISFYTFQTLSYTIDIYRGKLKATQSALDFFLFVAFFPQLVAGPIVRASEFLDQLVNKPQRDWAQFREGLERFMVGFFKKLIIADNIGLLVDNVYGNLDAYSGFEIALAGLGFLIQIYADFSGYSDMAIGVAALFGFKLPVNFRLPLLSSSYTEFWRRWHISLSTWFRDYLYIPLGGNRGSVMATYRNLIVTFLLTGLWHGAQWTFVAFGAWNGLALIFERVLFRRASEPGQERKMSRIWQPLTWIYSTAIAWVAFIFFRAQSIEQAFDVFGRIFGAQSGREGLFLYPLFNFVFAAMVFYHLAARFELRQRLSRLPAPLLWFLRPMAYTLYICLMAAFANFGERPFIYFAF